ncbi:hypothetical protein K7X08_037396 [Anisodus acutangulus]|uniref:Uncharacterized protein n=1 Tax=Anisodus acutangulus TaxID=402998 RepID=A0A9Q1MWD5_9SOLA|nr:hypothetical protein K7X08_037396 [Anisodus acutangulus]
MPENEQEKARVRERTETNQIGAPATGDFNGFFRLTDHILCDISCFVYLLARGGLHSFAKPCQHELR